MADFAEQIAKHVAKYQRRLAHVTQGTVIMVGKAIVERSPVGRWELWSDMWQKMRPASTYKAGEFKGRWSYSHGSVGGGAHMGQLALNDSKMFVRTAVAQARNIA